MKSVTAVVFVLSVFVSACVFQNAPRDNQDYKRVKDISQLVGLYENQGDPNGYLSMIIWKNQDGIACEKNGCIVKHQEIEFIQVKEIAHGLTIEAVSQNCVLFSQSYQEGKHFQFEDGLIILRDEFHLLFGKGQDPHLGPRRNRIMLGVDMRDDGKYMEEQYAAGLEFLVPIAGKMTREVRFTRLTDMREFGRCENSHF